MGLIDKVLGSIVKVIHSGATKELADKDPQFKKDHEIMQELQKKNRARYKTEEEFDAAVQKTTEKYTKMIEEDKKRKK